MFLVVQYVICKNNAYRNYWHNCVKKREYSFRDCLSHSTRSNSFPFLSCGPMLWVGAECRHSSRPVKRQIFSVLGAYRHEISPVGRACTVKESSSVQNQVFFRNMRRCMLSPFLRNTQCTQIASYIFVSAFKRNYRAVCRVICSGATFISTYGRERTTHHQK